jgi:hypothetical protein
MLEKESNRVRTERIVIRYAADPVTISGLKGRPAIGPCVRKARVRDTIALRSEINLEELS